MPPGDLARTLSRVLDAVRQLGNLPFTAVRKEDFEDTMQVATVSKGLDPTIRRLCRDATHAINRYPVKDPLAFESPGEQEDEDDDHDDNDDEEEDEDLPLAFEAAAEVEDDNGSNKDV